MEMEPTWAEIDALRSALKKEQARNVELAKELQHEKQVAAKLRTDLAAVKGELFGTDLDAVNRWVSQ